MVRTQSRFQTRWPSCLNSLQTPDWFSDLTSFQAAGDKLLLTNLLAGDLLKVATARSTYLFRITEPCQRRVA